MMRMLMIVARNNNNKWLSKMCCDFVLHGNNMPVGISNATTKTVNLKLKKYIVCLGKHDRRSNVVVGRNCFYAIFRLIRHMEDIG